MPTQSGEWFYNVKLLFHSYLIFTYNIGPSYKNSREHETHHHKWLRRVIGFGGIEHAHLTNKGRSLRKRTIRRSRIWHEKSWCWCVQSWIWLFCCSVENTRAYDHMRESCFDPTMETLPGRSLFNIEELALPSVGWQYVFFLLLS